MPTVGLLYPGHSAEDDFPALEERISGAVRLPVVITSVGEDAHRVDALLDIGSDARLADGASQLSGAQPDAVPSRRAMSRPSGGGCPKRACRPRCPRAACACSSLPRRRTP